MKQYKVDVPIGKKEPGPGWPVGAVITDDDLPANVIQIHLDNGFIRLLPDKKAKKAEQNEVINNG